MDIESEYRVIRVIIVLILFSLQGCGVRYSGPRVVEGGVFFSIKAPAAKKVAVSGTFNQWDTEKDLMAGPDQDGVWNIVVPVTEKRIEYLFIIDGEKWTLDPDAPHTDDGIGGKNSVLEVSRP